MIKFIEPNDEKIDRAGGKITFEGKTEYGVYKDMHAIPQNLAIEVFNDIKYPIENIKANVILAPFGLMFYDNGWSGTRYQGRAYKSHIIYGARKEVPTKDSIGSLIIHELGHNIMYDYYDCTYETHQDYIQEFKDIRGISNWDNWSTNWYKRPAEIWAEDFRYLFGTEYMTDETFDTMYKDIGVPSDKVKQFFLKIADALYEKHKDEIEDNSNIIIEDEPEPIIIKDNNVNKEPEAVKDNMIYMYLARYAHLDDIKVSVGDVCQADIMWHGKGISPATEIGIQGNTGLSTGTHLHIDVVKVPYDPNFRYKKYTQADIYAGNPPADKTELYYFLDETLFKGDYTITTHFNSQDYYEEFGRRHPAADIVSLGNKTIYWNRSTRGRVVHTGYDNAYGKNVVLAYLDVDFDSYEGQEPIFNEPEKEIRMDSDNDLSKTWLNSVGNWMYNMSNKSDVKSTWGQTSDFDRKVRYIEMHPNNLGVVTAKATTDEIGYAGINATFFGITKEGWYYPTSILKLKDAIIQGNANHLPYPQGTFCYYQDGTFGIEQIKSVNDLSKPVWYAIGGIEYVRDSMVTYNAAAEGFIGIYSDVHRRTTHVSIGLTKEGKILLTRHWDSTRAECAVHMKEMGCIYAIGLDGGGSAQYITPDEKRASTRKVANHLVATDLKI
jgi:hypothetical protein